MNRVCHNHTLLKSLRIMKLTLGLLLFFVVQGWAVKSYSQKTTLNLDMKNANLIDVFEEIENQSEFYFLFNYEQINVGKKVDINFKNHKINKVLDYLLEGTDLGYSIKERQIIIAKKAAVNNGRPSSGFVKQAKTVSGKVADDSGQPLPGVTVLVKGTTNGAVTNADGEYSIPNVASESILVFSFVGMLTQEIEVGNQSSINVTLEADAIGIEEVVAIGYGTQKRINLTGSVASVSKDFLENKPITSLSSALQGKMTGVNIVQSSGKPGDDGGRILIRGRGTFNVTTPLILVDGIPVGSMDDVNPNDVESISVLKDAASAAIYGARSANGVILITTREGRKQDMKITYNGYVGWQTPTRLPEVLGSYDYARFLNEALVNEGKPAKYTNDELQKFKDGTEPYKYPNTDWLDLLYSENGFQQNHYVRIDGGDQKTNYFLSFGYLDQNGNIVNTDFDRYTFRAKVNTTVWDRIHLSSNVSYSLGDKVEPTHPYFSGSFYYFPNNTKNMPPTIVHKYPDGIYGRGRDGNPIAWLEMESLDETEEHEVMGNFKADIDLFEGLTFTGIANVRNRFIFGDRFVKNIEYFDPVTKELTSNQGPNYQQDEIWKQKYISLQALLNYTKTIGGHNFKVLAGASQEEYRQDYDRLRRQNYINNELHEIDAGPQKDMQTEGNAYEWALRSYFGRINYDYNGKYLIEANLRVDGSSRFKKGNRYGYFPSFSAGWRLSEESFMESLDFVSNLKIRASYGESGNNNVTDPDGNIANYPYQPVLNFGQTVFGNQYANYVTQTKSSNEDLVWETTAYQNLGVDLSIFDGKWSLSTDLFKKHTTDILLTIPVPQEFGLSNIQQNAGIVDVKGWELNLGHNNKLGDFSYNINATLSKTNEEIVNQKGTGPWIKDNIIQKLGYPTRAYYGLEVEGIFKTQAEIDGHATQDPNTDLGDLMYKDQLTVDSDGDGIPDKADGKINDDDRVILGNDLPDLVYSFNVGVNYKNWSLDAFFQGVSGVKAYVRDGAYEFHGGVVYNHHLDHWTKDNPNASYPRLLENWSHNMKYSSFWIRDASYLRLKNLTFAYTFDNNFIQKINVSKLKVFFSGRNLITLTDLWDGYDPENYSSGMYPQVKTFTFGINAEF